MVCEVLCNYITQIKYIIIIIIIVLVSLRLLEKAVTAQKFTIGSFLQTSLLQNTDISESHACTDPTFPHTPLHSASTHN